MGHNHLSVGTTAWVCPRTGYYWVECYAGGGGGATYGRTTGAHGAGGGGGGAYAASSVYCVKDVSYTIAVGQGGAGATANNANGSNGNNTHFNNNAIMAANGRFGGRNGVGGPAGLNTASVGTITLSGGNGADNSALIGGGGGAGAGICAKGNNGAAPTAGVGGFHVNQWNNGITDLGGSGGNGGASNVSGNATEEVGGGGGGAGGNSGTTIKSGGNGGNGLIRIIDADIWGMDTFVIYGRA